MLYADLWRLRHPGKPGVLDNWDNGDWDRRDPPADASIDTFETCERYCRNEQRCLQWTWLGGDEKRCILMSSISYGSARKPEYVDADEKREASPAQEAREKKSGKKMVAYRSGWVEDRIQEWVDARRCEAVQWVGPSTSRIF